MTKEEARRLARRNIAAMSDAVREWADGAIADALSSLDAFKKAKSVFVYLNSQSEPATEEIVGLLLAMEKTVSVPRVRGNEMDAVVITPFTNFKKNRWGILEPVGGRTASMPDLSIVPIVAFDGLKRAGHGKGYYDRFLTEFPCVKIGLAYSCQRAEGLITDIGDVDLDMIITEKDIITSSNVSVANQFGGEL